MILTQAEITCQSYITIVLVTTISAFNKEVSMTNL